jgi:hypothetical protein
MFYFKYMTIRWLYSLICVVFGLALLVGGLLLPAHLRALDAAVIRNAGRNGSALLESMQIAAGEKRLGTAQQLLRAAQIANIPDSEPAGTAFANLVRQNPDALFWGDDARLENIFANGFKLSDQNSSLADFIVREENRDTALAHLGGSPNAAAQELLRSRSLTNTVIFSPSQSASGQAFDAAVSICGLLLDGGHLTAGMSNEICNVTTQANRGGSSQPLEQVLMDCLSLGERFNWDQLTAFAGQIQNLDTLRRLADAARNAGEKLPVLFAAVQLSGQPDAVAKYLAKFPDTGMPDLGASLCYGAGGVRELALRQQRFYDSSLERQVTAFYPFGRLFDFAANLSFQNPWSALAAKWFLYLLSGFFLAAAMHFAVPPLERQLQVRGFHLLREFLFSLGFLLVVLLLSEPFLAQDTQKGTFSLRLFPSTVGGAVPARIAGGQPTEKTVMSPTILLTLLVFFVLQALIYISCLVKLAEIRRQKVPPRMKLKLLENEDHLFDAGLYLGFVGTIISLIVASMGLIKFSLMAAYSSTSFGIIFVVIFKIFHLRPERRKLLLAAEAQNPAAEVYIPTVAPTSAVPS